MIGREHHCQTNAFWTTIGCLASQVRLADIGHSMQRDNWVFSHYLP
jgi:hypothetical protein